MPNCEIISGGVKIAENIKIPIKKYFLFFFKILIFNILNLTNKIKSTGNSNDIPLAKSKNMINFMYSEYLDSSSNFKPVLKKFSNETKNSHISGIRR